MAAYDPSRLPDLFAAEQARFAETHPQSRALFERARGSLLSGVPMHWMLKWAGGFPLFVHEAHGARFLDVDGHEYVDLCLGDTGSMTGHAPPATVAAVAEQAANGITLMLPAEAAIGVGEDLVARFGLPAWQFALTATDANRFSIRIARHITGRPKILVHNHCYHGSVDETFANLGNGGAVVSRRGNVGPPVSPDITTRVVEFNDVEGLERELAHGDVAAVLCEPALTNVGIVLPEPGYHDALRAATRRHGTLLIIDETHTICAGPGGYTRAHGLDPDMLVIGKPIASGVPAATYGMSAAVAADLERRLELEDIDTGGIGGTLAGNALSLAAMHATLTQVLTREAFERMIPRATRWTDGVQAVIDRTGLPWHVTQLGCRAEYLFVREVARNGSEAAEGMDHDLERFMHLFALNRGVMLTPFHNMALMSPATTDDDVDRHSAVFAESVDALFAAGVCTA